MIQGLCCHGNDSCHSLSRVLYSFLSIDTLSLNRTGSNLTDEYFNGMYPNAVTSKFKQGICVCENDRGVVSMTTVVGVGVVVVVAINDCLWVALIGDLPVI